MCPGKYQKYMGIPGFLDKVGCTGECVQEVPKVGGNPGILG